MKTIGSPMHLKQLYGGTIFFTTVENILLDVTAYFFFAADG